MLVMAIDTSGIACSVAVANEEKLIGEFYTDYKIKHSEKLLPLVDGLLENVNLTMNDIDCFAYTCGPGSFTGLRIGAATVKAFAQARDKKVCQLSTLEVLAYGQNQFEGYVCPIMDAQRSEVYTTLYKKTEEGFALHGSEEAKSIDILISELQSLNERILFCGDAVFKYRDIITKEVKNALFADNASLMPKASAAAALALKKIEKAEKLTDYSEISINYIRNSDAEVNYKIKL